MFYTPSVGFCLVLLSAVKRVECAGDAIAHVQAATGTAEPLVTLDLSGKALGGNVDAIKKFYGGLMAAKPSTLLRFSLIMKCLKPVSAAE